MTDFEELLNDLKNEVVEVALLAGEPLRDMIIRLKPRAYSPTPDEKGLLHPSHWYLDHVHTFELHSDQTRQTHFGKYTLPSAFAARLCLEDEIKALKKKGYEIYRVEVLPDYYYPPIA